jgi:hypothetical protein
MFCEWNMKEAPVSETDPIAFRPTTSGTMQQSNARSSGPGQNNRPVCFTRQELQDILNVYGRNVASGEWRDYAIDMNRDKAIFSIFRRTSEMPIYRVEKNPRLARKQGAYSVITATGLILKRGGDLKRVLAAIDKRIRLVES